MHIGEFITPERVGYRLRAASKKRALELVSGLIAAGGTTPAETEIFDCLVARERLGSTGLGHGIAIPHGRLKNIAHIRGAQICREQLRRAQPAAELYAALTAADAEPFKQAAPLR